MNRTQFQEICNLELVDAGSDWHDAGVRGAYFAAVIRDADDFATINTLLDPDKDLYFASAERKAGQGWYKHNGYGKLFGDAKDIAREMAAQFARFLDSKDNTTFYSDSDIENRKQALLDNPALEGESEADHLNRVADLQDDGWLAPQYVTEAGYWDCNSQDILLSAAQIADGIWYYDYDNWQQSVIAVVIDSDADDDSESDDE
jgi:hypothetical protein